MITEQAPLDTCPLGQPACVEQPGRLSPVISGDGRHAGQCPACRRVWYRNDDGTPTWAYASYHGGYLPAGDPRADGWRRVARYRAGQLRVRLPRLRRDCGETFPRLRRY